MRIDREYHHFKGEHLTRSEWVERFVVDRLVHTDVTDADRESSQAWELMHSSTCKAFMHVLAEKRGVDVELARVAGALHDYYVIKTGKYKNHARLGAPLVRDILAHHGGFSDSEIEFVSEVVANHSDKHIFSDQPHVELVKDADVFDCSLYYGTEFYYLTRKPLPVCHEYFMRVLRVREELGMPLPRSYRCLSRDGNSRLKEIGGLIPGTPDDGAPTALMLGLWALASSSAGEDWPLLMLYYRDGVSRWYGPTDYVLGSGAQTGLPDWSHVKRLRQSSIKQAARLDAAAQQGRVADLLCGYRDAFVPAWTGFTADASTRERAAVALRDFECDPRGDDKLEALVEQRMVQMMDDGEGDLDGPAVDGWELESGQESAIDELARLHAFATLRGDLLRGSRQALQIASEKVSRDIVRQFPSEAFGCEESPVVSDGAEAWLAVAWPRFGRFEFVVGAEADDRFAALAEFFADTDRTEAAG